MPQYRIEEQRHGQKLINYIHKVAGVRDRYTIMDIESGQFLGDKTSQYIWNMPDTEFIKVVETPWEDIMVEDTKKKADKKYKPAFIEEEEEVPPTEDEDDLFCKYPEEDLDEGEIPKFNPFPEKYYQCRKDPNGIHYTECVCITPYSGDNPPEDMDFEYDDKGRLQFITLDGEKYKLLHWKTVKLEDKPL